MPPRGFQPPKWCDGTLKACLNCGENDRCNLPISVEEREALRIASALDCIIDPKEKRSGKKKTVRPYHRREENPQEEKLRRMSSNRRRYATDPAYREYHRQYLREWRKRKKEEQEREMARRREALQSGT